MYPSSVYIHEVDLVFTDKLGKINLLNTNISRWKIKGNSLALWS